MSRKKLIAEIPVLKVKYPAQGEGKIGTTPVYFKGGVEGQRVQVQIQKKKKDHYEAKILNTVLPSHYEKRVPCKPFGECGGCSYQRMYYPQELEYKEKQLREHFGAAGIDLSNFCIHPSPKERAYRNKMEYTFGDQEKGGPLFLGLHRKGRFYEIVDTTTCNIVDEDFETIRKGTQAYFRELGTPYYRKGNHTGVLRHLVVRYSETKPQIVVHLVTSSQGEVDAEAYAKFLLSLRVYSKITGVVHTINDGLGDTVQSDISHVVYGSPDIYETVHGLDFRISPMSFFQTNTKGAELLYERAIAACGDREGKVVYDLFSGTGTIGQILSQHVKRVVSVEIVQDAVNDAIENAKRNKITNMEFICGDVLEVLDNLKETPDLIVVDPPRMGIHPRAIPKIARLDCETIVYVSCNPVTLVQDLEVFKEWGYGVKTIECVDMFPRTPHVETVVLLSKLDVNQHIKVELEMDELDLTTAESKATYEEIKDFVFKTHAMKVSNLYISQVKKKCGLEVGKNYNVSNKENPIVPNCPPEKEEAIREALEYFKMI